MFTTESPIDMQFFVWGYLIIQDVHERKRIQWRDENTLAGSRSGTLRGFVDSHENDSMAEAIVRITLDSGVKIEVPLVDLMNSDRMGGYERL